MKFPTLATLFILLSICASAQQKDLNPVQKEKNDITKSLEKESKASPQLLADIQKQLNTPIKAFDISKKSSLPLNVIEEEKTKIEAELTAARTARDTLAISNAERTERIAKLPDDIALARLQLSNIPSSPESNNQQRIILEQRLKNLEAEQKNYTATTALFSAREQLYKRNISILEAKQKAWQQLFDTKQAAETEQIREETVAEAQRFSSIPILAELTSDNAELAKLRQQVSKQTALYSSRLAHNLELLKEVQEQRSIAQDRIRLLESAKLKIDTETGKLLRIQRNNLPSESALTLDLQKNIRASASAQIKILEIRKELSSLPIDIDLEAATLDKKIDSKDIRQPEIKNLLQQRQSLLNDLIKDYSNYIVALTKSSSALRELTTERNIYKKYLDERLLWIPSAEPIATADLLVERNALLNLVSKNQIGLWFTNLVDSLRNHPISWGFLSAILIYLLARHRKFKQILQSTAEIASRKSNTCMLPTFKALAVTLLLALPFPLLLGFLSWRVQEPTGISTALYICACFIFLFSAFLKMTGKNGFLRNHVNMADFRAKILHCHLRWFVLIVPFILFFFFALPGTQSAPQTGRIFFALLMITQIIFLHLILKPSKNVLTSGPWFAKIIWFLALILPVSFLIGSGLGYISSVNTLRQQTMASVCIIIIGLLIVKILEHWVLLSRRKLAIEIAHKKYQSIINAENGENNDPKSRPSLEELETHATDVTVVETQTRKLLQIGMSVLVVFGILTIWSSSLPALSFLNKVELWGGDKIEQTTTNSSSVTSNPVTKALTPSETSKSPVVTTTESKATSLQDLLLAGLIIGLFLAAAKNLPGLLELSVLRRLHLKPGGNYAITTVMRYVLIAIGFLIAFRLIGVTWASVQWLAAAITLGIGFGLQEIFANFVAGIILLFERPIRLGDIVTVGNDISGKVTRIEIRATTIQQFNNRELIVPNKEFITGSLINWTLSNNIQRFEIPVGIAYGSDTKKATKILHDIVKKHPAVLEDPEPQIIFSTFGPSTLDFLIRAYVGKVEDFASTQSELHYLIDNAFREADINIAIPQQDIYIRSLPENTHFPTRNNLPTEENDDITKQKN